MTKPTFRFEKPLWKKNYLVIGVDEVGRGAIAGPVVASAVAFAINPEQRTKNLEHIGIDDSKRLTAKRREELAKMIKKMALAYGIGEAGVGTINSIGIKKATERAMRRAIKNVQCTLLRSVNNRVSEGQVMYNLQKSCHSEPRQGGARNLGRLGRPHNDASERKTFLARSLTSFEMTKGQYFFLIDGFSVKYLPGGLKNQKAIVKGDQKSISIAAASIIAKVYRDDKMRLLDKKYPHYQFSRHKGYGTEKHKNAILKFGETVYHRQQFLTTFIR